MVECEQATQIWGMAKREDIKFLGSVKSFNEAKNFGMVECEQATQIWGGDIYAFRDVLASCGAAVGDMIRFGIHINTRGQPQVSLPVFKVGEDGLALDVPEGTSFINAEDAVAESPEML